MTQGVIGLFAIAFIGLLCTSSMQAGDDLPPVFDRRPYLEAKKAAEEGNKWFIVKATAVWCGPCKQMDKTTWRDDKVVQWLKDNAIIVALDVDEEPKLAEELRVQAMPTTIAFKNGTAEFDRVVGYKESQAMVSWLEGIAKGEKSIVAIRKRASAPEGDRVDVSAKMDLAQALMNEGKDAESADEFVWLWKNMLLHDPAMYGVRLSFMAGYMEQLAQQSDEARSKFVALRDETGKRLEGETVEVDDVVDWVVLNNRVLNDAEATVQWYDRVKDQPKWQPFIDRVRRDLSEMFIVLNRWDEVGRLSTDPLAELESDWNSMKRLTELNQKLLPVVDAEQRKEIEAGPLRMFRESCGQRYAGLLAAGRADAAAEVAAKAREYDPSPEMRIALVSTALSAGRPLAVHKEWIADTNDASLMKRLADALAKTPPAKP